MKFNYVEGKKGDKAEKEEKTEKTEKILKKVLLQKSRPKKKKCI